jgi:hypothetical protein
MGKTSTIEMSDPATVAKMMLDGMEHNAYRVMAAPDVRLMDRLSRLSPQRAATIIYKQMRSLLPS